MENCCSFIMDMDIRSDIDYFNRVVSDDDFEFIVRYPTKNDVIERKNGSKIPDRKYLLPGSWIIVNCGDDSDSNHKKFLDLETRLKKNKYGYKFVIYRDTNAHYTFGYDLVKEQ